MGLEVEGLGMSLEVVVGAGKDLTTHEATTRIVPCTSNRSQTWAPVVEAPTSIYRLHHLQMQAILPTFLTR